jgi:hypothetical protein
LSVVFRGGAEQQVQVFQRLAVKTELTEARLSSSRKVNRTRASPRGHEFYERAGRFAQEEISSK